MPNLEKMAYALLQGWQLEKDKGDVLLSTDKAAVQGAVLEARVTVGRLGEGCSLRCSIPRARQNLFIKETIPIFSNGALSCLRAVCFF